MLEFLPSVAVGTSRLIEREALAGFLDKVQESGDVAAVLERIRQEKTLASQKRLRSLVQRDDGEVSLTSLPESLTMERGRVEVRFHTLEELAEAMYFLARVMQQDGAGFARDFEPVSA